MALDINKVKAKLASLQNKGGGKTFEKTDFTKIYWKPKVGSQDIRIVPSKYNPEWPFQEVSFHKDIVKKTMYCLTNFGEKDPIIEFTNALKEEARQLKAAGKNSDEEWNLAKKLKPKTRTFAQVLVRGEEHLGVRLWEFGPKVYEQLMKIAANEDYQNFTDVSEGTDLKVEGTQASFNSISFIEPSISPRKKESPLSTDKALLKKYLEEQHDPLGFAYQKFTYDQIEGFFAQWLNPDSEGEEIPEVEEVEEVSGAVVVDEDPLKAELEATLEVEEDDDLPFIPDPPKAKKATTTTKAKVTEVAAKVVTPVTSNKAKFKSLFDKK